MRCIIDNTTLFEENQNIVHFCFNQLNKTDFVLCNADDIKQEGFISLWKCILTFDKNRCEKLASYAFPCVRNAMLKWIRDNSKENNISIEEPIQINNYEDKNVYLKDLLFTETDFDSLKDLVDDLLKEYETWLKRKKKSEEEISIRYAEAYLILNELLNDPKITREKIKNKYNIPKSCTSRILSELRNILKKYL